jgi:hypothetical protein
MFFTGRETLNSFGKGDDGELSARGCKTEVREQVPGRDAGHGGQGTARPTFPDPLTTGALPFVRRRGGG